MHSEFGIKRDNSKVGVEYSIDAMVEGLAIDRVVVKCLVHIFANPPDLRNTLTFTLSTFQTYLVAKRSEDVVFGLVECSNVLQLRNCYPDCKVHLAYRT